MPRDAAGGMGTIPSLTLRFTDPARMHPTYPGHVEGNTVLTCHGACNRNDAEVEELMQRYRAGTVGDVHDRDGALLWDRSSYPLPK